MLWNKQYESSYVVVKVIGRSARALKALKEKQAWRPILRRRVAGDRELF